ncbi:flagellar hook-associated protein FlgL [Nocardioides deserti]|uniref:Flagellar hook-associated protein FlgL n=1 Tax=Nocardioides deserti TaxID=1588644 RepID=A0ABR6UEP3_9ACTN|nr:flagellar hook-associated protein FlgL [Nocardioides deserti]MBC2962439.1 flagellar hook-associated protein FlgL [Nocardioides deserti]GGO78022.1 flagellar hook-associated protein 3 [Nocardioides deserti]
MTTFRVTQTMLANSSLRSMQAGLGRLAAVQEQLTTGRVLNRPSDSPTDTTSAMRIRSSLARAEQHARNADDAEGRLGLIDSTLSSMTNQVRRARELVLQGANASNGASSRQALATEIDQLRESLLGDANTSYLERPIFGGITSKDHAYDASTGAWDGTAGAVERQVGPDVTVRVDLAGPEVFGPDGASLFDTLEAASLALVSGDAAGIDGALDALKGHLDRIGSAQSVVGARQAQVERAVLAAGDSKLALTTRLAAVENVDLPRALVDLNLQEVAYQAALGATARVTQPSLLDFLR